VIVPEKSQELIIDAADAESLEAEALIKEARQRQRKRQLFIAVVVLVVALGSVIWVASAAGTRAPSSNKTGPGKSAGGLAWPVVAMPILCNWSGSGESPGPDSTDRPSLLLAAWD